MSSAASITSSGKPISSARDPLKRMWMETNWANLSRQGQSLGLPKLPYYVPETMLLSKEGQLYDVIGPDKAPHACPVLLDAGKIEWHSYLDGSKGDKADVLDEDDWQGKWCHHPGGDLDVHHFALV